MSSVHIKEGQEYIYISKHPANCTGHWYRLHKFVVDVPSYQKKTLVEALSGPDAGLWFICTFDNFARRYRNPTIEELRERHGKEAYPDPLEPKEIDLRTKGSGV